MVLAASAYARADGAVLIRVRANRIAFYYNRFVVEADGNVDVRTSDGLRLRGQAFSMDLRLNRFLVAGNVQVRAANASLSCAAVSDFLTFRRVYAIPVTNRPDRWTFLDDDFSHPIPGRVMPGDAFEFASTGSDTPSFVASSVTIGATSFVRLTGGVRADVLGRLVPVPPFYVNFAPTPALARNSLSGASADLTYQFAGNANSISALHVRYDSTNHLYAAFEEHVAGEHEYAVFSLNPATAPGKFWNLITGDTIGSRFQLNSFTQLYTFQYGFGKPYASAQYTLAQASEALPRWSIQATGLFTNYNMLGTGTPTTLPNGQTVGELDHPTQVQVTATSFQERIFGSPFYEQYFVGAGFAHDSDVVPGSTVGQAGLQYYGGVYYTTIWDRVAGFTIQLPQLQFGNLNSAYDRYVVSSTFSKQRQWYSVPHHVDTTTFNATISRQVTRPFGVYAGYGTLNTGDYYLHGGYAVSSPLINGVYAPGFQAFKGVATQRTFSFGTNYVPSPEFTVSLLYRHHDDFPVPVPGLFPLPPLNPLGQFIYSTFLGQPPNDLTGDVHFQVAPHLAFDVARTYYFGFATLKWSPTTLVQLESPQ